MSSARRNDLVMLGVGALVILLDQLTKHWIVQYFTAAAGYKPPIQILGSVLTLEYLQNSGVAFSLLTGQAVLFLFILIAIGVIGAIYWRARESGSLLLKVTFGLILGGAFGNLIDRFSHTYVVDFIHFQIPGVFDFAIFNIADSAITIGVFTLAYLLWRSAPTSSTASAPTSKTHAPDAEQKPAPSAQRNTARTK